MTEATARDLDQLYLTKLTLIAICQNLNYHTGRYNTHGFSVGVPEHAEDALKLDNIAHSPQAFDVDGIITDGLRAATDYVYRWQERGEEQRTGQSVAIGDRFVWPEDSYRHEVFMPLQAGIVAIHHIFALDEAKAIHPSEFIIAKQGMPALPTLPKREVLSAS